MQIKEGPASDVDQVECCLTDVKVKTGEEFAALRRATTPRRRSPPK